MKDVCETTFFTFMVQIHEYAKLNTGNQICVIPVWDNIWGHFWWFNCILAMGMHVVLS